MAQVIGEISKNAVSMATYKDRQESSKLKDQAKDAENANDETKAKALYAQAADIDKRIDDKFGIGSTNGQAIAAVTAVLQGLAGDNIGQAVAGGLSPYVNAKIKELTKDNDEANIAAHALWGAIEAQAGGNNALAGATAAASGEMAAKLLTQQIYGKEPQDLTASEKETISALSQVVGALSAVAVADNGSDGYRGAEVAKSAVENNQFGMDVAGNLGVILAREQENCDDECKQKLDTLQLRSAEAQLTGALSILGIILAPEFATSSTLITGAFGGGSEFIGELTEHNWDISKVDMTKVVISTGVGVVTKNMGVFNTALLNGGVETAYSFKSGKDPLISGGTSFTTTLVGGVLGKGIEIPLDKKFNPTWKFYTDKIEYRPYPIHVPYKPSLTPSITGNALDNTSSWILENRLKNYLNEKVYKNEK